MPNVLIVDEDRDHANALADALQGSVGEVRLAYDAEQTLDAIILWRPEAIIVDAALPRLDDGELARRLRRRNRGQMTLLALSRAVGATRAELMLNGFDEVIQKPASLADALSAICRTVESPLAKARWHVHAAEPPNHRRPFRSSAACCSGSFYTGHIVTTPGSVRDGDEYVGTGASAGCNLAFSYVDFFLLRKLCEFF